MLRAIGVFLLVTFIASLAPDAVASDRDDADLELMLAERRGLDVRAPLRWHYAIVDVPQRELASLRAALVRLDFTVPATPEMDAENDAGTYELWVEEQRVHTVESYAKRLAEVRAAARAHRARLGHWSSHPPDGG